MPDPRSGAITKDAFLEDVRKPDNTPLIPKIRANFVCLQQTGDFCPN